MNKNVLVIFGPAVIPSITEEAKKVAKDQGCQIAIATYKGEPASLSNIMFADGYKFEDCDGNGVKEIILFECEMPVTSRPGIKILDLCYTDHWKRYGLQRIGKNYFERSSLGKLFRLLKIKPTENQLMSVAMELCPGEAYNGKCKDITKDNFSVFRFAHKLEQYAVNPETKHLSNPETLMKSIMAAEEVLKKLPVMDGMYDARGLGFVEELLEAAWRLGLPCILRENIKNNENPQYYKYVLRGMASADKVEDFYRWSCRLDYNVTEVTYPQLGKGYAEVMVQAEPYQHSV